jgi:threonine dehydrogenase-like Zn-dependent dehydrogenase
VEPEATDLSRFQAVVEATGNADALDKVLEVSAPGTAILLLGFPYAPRPFNFASIVGNDKIVVGSVGSTAEEFGEAIRLLPAIETGPFLRKVLPLDDVRSAWTLARARTDLKVILQADPDAV